MADLEIVLDFFAANSAGTDEHFQGLVPTGYYLGNPNEQMLFGLLIAQILIEQNSKGFFEFIAAFQFKRRRQLCHQILFLLFG